MKEKKNKYRIYYVNNKGDDVVVKRFESKNNDTARKILKKYQRTHKDGKTYYYGDAGRWIGSDGKAYDTQKELSKNFKYKYTDESRKWDIEEIKHFLKDYNKKKLTGFINTLDKLITKIEDSYVVYEQDLDLLVHEINNTDLKTASESKMDDFKHRIDKLRDKKFDLCEALDLLKDKHSIKETWDITHHVLNDFLYNIPRLIKHKTGVPCYFIQLAKKDPNKIDSTDEEYKKGEELYNKELENFLLHIRLYDFYSNYGIIDNKDEEMKKIYDKYKDTIPYREDTYKEIDYKKLHEITQKHWNAIWDWLKEYGQCIWD